MAASSRVPNSVVLSRAIVCIAAQLVPRTQRQDWKDEWYSEIWHRWQFLVQVREWNRRESLNLVRNCLGALPDAFWHLASQEAVRARMRNCARSPWSCLASLAVALLVLGLLTSGFPAARQILGVGVDSPYRDLLFIWLHPVVGGVDKGVPPDAIPGWSSHSRHLSAVAPFNFDKARLVQLPPHSVSPIVIDTEPSLFKVIPVRLEAGVLPSSSGLVLDHRTWVSVFHSNPHVIGSMIQVGVRTYPVTAVLPASFQFLTRQPSIYLVEPRLLSSSAFVVARAHPGVNRDRLTSELVRIAEDVSYYFFASQLRVASFYTALLIPLGVFAGAVFVSTVMTLIAWRIRPRHVLAALKGDQRKAALVRVSFFTAKLTLVLLLVFTAVLEGSRTESAVLFASLDPASGPVLVWFYIIGAMGAFFWAVADQRARCRVCLRLLAFPVRIGCPGCLLLDWSGTELFCSEGHGVLHVPHLARSWDEDSQHWISLDESWRGLFANSK